MVCFCQKVYCVTQGTQGQGLSGVLSESILCYSDYSGTGAEWCVLSESILYYSDYSGTGAEWCVFVRKYTVLLRLLRDRG